jgi:hypothetical protein
MSSLKQNSKEDTILAYRKNLVTLGSPHQVYLWGVGCNN